MKKNIFSFILGAIIFSVITVSAYAYMAEDISFSPTDETWEVNNTEDAINDLYDLVGKRMTASARRFLKSTDDIVSLDDLFSSIKFCSDSTRLNNAISNEIYAAKILSNSYAIKALDNCSPTVSTNTSKVFASSSFSSTYAATKAFDDDTASYWGPGAGISYKNQYIGYDFTNQVWVYKMVINMTNGKQNTDYVLEASNDNSNYTIIKNGLHQGGGTVTIIPNTYTKKYRYYRVRMLSSIVQSGDGNTVIPYLRFYAK